MVVILGRFARDTDGATAIEYGLIAGLIAVGLIVAFTTFGQSIQGLFTHVQGTAGNAIDNAGS